jgi:hypothetical protein
VGPFIAPLFIDPVPFVTLSVIGSWAIAALLTKAPSPCKPKPVPCPNCHGTGKVRRRDPETGRPYHAGCPVCHGVGWLAEVTLFTYDKLTRCPHCEAGHVIDIPPYARYPDGTPLPGAKAVLMNCLHCNGTGWNFKADEPAFHSARPWIPPR